MITTVRSGFYKLIETKTNIKILYLENDVFAWVEPEGFGELLIVSHKPHRVDCVLSIGRYYIYKVENEPGLVDHVHLELETGRNTWQGYLLLTGLPDKHKYKARIIPTMEIITGNSRFQDHLDVHKKLATL